MTKKNAINILIESTIAHAVLMARESLRTETRINSTEINESVLVALAHVVAKELMNGGAGNFDPVTKVPNGSGTLFLIALQDELQRLHGLRKGQQ